jgi:hypothetical protein
MAGNIEESEHALRIAHARQQQAGAEQQARDQCAEECH